MRTIKPEQQAARREQILDAAVETFAREGFHKSSMTDIAASAGMSAGNLYRYFKSKEEIIRAMAERERRESSMLMADIAAAPDLVEALAETMAELVLAVSFEKAVVDLEIAVESLRNPEMALPFLAIEAEICGQLADAIRHGQTQGLVSSVIEAKAGARLLIDLSYGLSASGIGRTAQERATAAAEVRRLIRAYLGTGAGR